MDITEDAWGRYTRALSTFLPLKEVACLHSARFDVDWNCVSAHFKRQIIIKGDQLITPSGARKKPISREDGRFNLSDLPVVVRVELDRLIIRGEPLCERLTTPGTVFVKRAP